MELKLTQHLITTVRTRPNASSKSNAEASAITFLAFKYKTNFKIWNTPQHSKSVQRGQHQLWHLQNAIAGTCYAGVSMNVHRQYDFPRPSPWEHQQQNSKQRVHYRTCYSGY